MRIAHVVPTYLPATRYGGPIYSVHGLCRALAAQGHDVHVFTTSVDGPSDSAVPHDRIVELDGVHVRYFQSRYLRRLYYAPLLLRRLRAELSGFDVVHLHSVYLWPTNVAARACIRARVPYVLSPRGMLVSELIERKNRLIKKAWLGLIERQTIRRASRMHYTSQRERVEAERLYPSAHAIGCVVPNGVDAPLTAPRMSEALRTRLGDAPYGLFLGRVHWVKGIDRLLRAASETDVRLVLCGNDEEGYASTVDSLISSLRLGERVLRLEPTYGDDKWALLANARMLILPSISENFGNVVPEAMIMGCPVIATRGVGASEVVARANAGVVCEATDEALRAALLRVWLDDAARAEMSRSGRAFAEAELRWAQVAQHMTAQYDAARRELPRSREAAEVSSRA